MEDKNDHDDQMLMLGGGGGGSSSSVVSGTPRWNPTKEQINMLEGFYRQGMRTPSADQIQEITSRLRAYGHIEGKNVFYWFQNHKARQRQRQRQKLENSSNMAHFNHFIHPHNNKPYASSSVHLAPLLPSPLPPFNNVAGSSFYIPQANVGYYPHYNYNSKVLLPSITTGTINTRRTSAGMNYKFENKDDGSSSAATLILHDKAQHQMMSMNYNGDNNHKTLPLFPQHPTGILDDKLDNSFVSSSSSTEGSDHRPSKSSEFGVDPGNKPFIDFFANL